MQQEIIHQPKIETMKLVVTLGVSERLSAMESYQAIAKLIRKTQAPNPNNTTLWEVAVGSNKVWGILDENMGPNEESVLTILLPEEY